MTTPLARNEPQILTAPGLGAAWLMIAGKILAEGIDSRYDDRPVRELSLVTLSVGHPDPEDGIIARYAEPDRLAWMRANFTDHTRVAALGGADSLWARPPGETAGHGGQVRARVRDGVRVPAGRAGRRLTAPPPPGRGT